MALRLHERSRAALQMLTDLREDFQISVKRIAKAMQTNASNVEACLKNARARKALRKNQYAGLEKLYSKYANRVRNKIKRKGSEMPVEATTVEAQLEPLGVPTIVKRAFECVAAEDAKPLAMAIRDCQIKMAASNRIIADLVGMSDSALVNAYQAGDIGVGVYRKLRSALPVLEELAADAEPGKTYKGPTYNIDVGPIIDEAVQKKRERTIELARLAREVDAGTALEEAMAPPPKVEESPAVEELPEGVHVRIHEFLQAKCWECGEPANKSSQGRLPRVCSYCEGKIKIQATVKGWFDPDQIEEEV
jgi:hypothetical protein